MDKNYEKGILYIAFGASFTKEAVMSYKSLRRYMPLIPVCFMTDSLDRLAAIEDSNVIKTEIKPRHIRSKVDFIVDSPFDKTLYLDSDTIIVRDVSDMFDILDRFDIGVTNDYARKREKYSKSVPEYAKIPYAFSEVNGGVMAFNSSDEVKEFLSLWREYFYKYFHETSGWDQVSLRISLWESQVRIHHFPFEYNIRSRANRQKQDNFKHQFGEQHMAPRIYHMHYSPEVHHGRFDITKLDELEKIIINQAVWY